MDLIDDFLNLVAPPFTFFSLCFILPPLWAFNFFHYILRSVFRENVAGKVVLITGASSGIGEHLAYEYAKRGACLALCARRQKSLGQVAHRACQYGSPEVIAAPSDVSNVGDCKRLVEDTVNHFGRLDHLVNNAGISTAVMFEEATDITNFRPIMETNFWGSVYTTHFALPHLRRSKGKIVMISSPEAWLPTPRTAVYSASKLGLEIFYDTLRVEVGPEIHITTVSPGFLESELCKGKFLLEQGNVEVDQDLRDVVVSIIPVGRVGKYVKAIVDGVVRGDRFLTVPAWYKMMYVWELMCPQLIDWLLRLTFLSKPGTPSTEALSKKILDATAAKNFLYPSSIRSPQLKAD